MQQTGVPDAMKDNDMINLINHINSVGEVQASICNGSFTLHKPISDCRELTVAY